MYKFQFLSMYVYMMFVRPMFPRLCLLITFASALRSRLITLCNVFIKRRCFNCVPFNIQCSVESCTGLHTMLTYDSCYNWLSKLSCLNFFRYKEQYSIHTIKFCIEYYNYTYFFSFDDINFYNFIDYESSKPSRLVYKNIVLFQIHGKMTKMWNTELI